MPSSLPTRRDRPRIFISYSHDSVAHEERVLGLSERLRRDGFEAQIDQYVVGTLKEDWSRWMLDQLDWADSVLLVCTETYYRRFRGHETPDRGYGVDWEGNLITNEIYQARSRTRKFVPVLFTAAAAPFIPEPLQGRDRFVLDSDPAYEALKAHLTGSRGVEPGPVGELKVPPRKVGQPLTFPLPSFHAANVPLDADPRVGVSGPPSKPALSAYLDLTLNRLGPAGESISVARSMGQKADRISADGPINTDEGKFEGRADPSQITGASPSRDLVYISYSHQDKKWHRKLRRILDADPDLRDRVWDDTKIPASADFAQEIDQHVARARVMIMLGSEQYFRPNSGAAHCETQPALEAHRKGELQILWFPVGVHSYSNSPVGHLMAATGVGTVPLDQLSAREQNLALRTVHQAVRRGLGLVVAENPSSAPSSTPRQRRRNLPPSLATQTSKTMASSSIQSPVDFVILTPLEEEREAMLAHLGKPKRLPPTHEDLRVYYPATLPVTFTDGSTGNYQIILTEPLGMGHVDSANAVGDAIRRWRPKYVLVMGIAGGLTNAGVKVGDVLIADQVADYELQKLTPEKDHIRWSVHRADPRLLTAAKQLRPEDWRPWVKEARPGAGQPQRHIGPICTGNKVIADGLVEQYRDVWTKLIGVEMEAGGVASAALQAANAPGFFMVRGVSDLADAEKDKPQTQSWRAYACDVAAAFVMAFLKSGPVPLNP